MTGRAGLIRTAPQAVEHVDGWAFASAGRYAMSYTDAEHGTLRVPVEHGAGVTIVYTNQMTRRSGDGSTSPVTAEEHAVALPRVLLAVDELTDGTFRVDEGAP